MRYGIFARMLARCFYDGESEKDFSLPHRLARTAALLADYLSLLIVAFKSASLLRMIASSSSGEKSEPGSLSFTGLGCFGRMVNIMSSGTFIVLAFLRLPIIYLVRHHFAISLASHDGVSVERRIAEERKVLAIQ